MSFPYSTDIQASSHVRRFHTAPEALTQTNANHCWNMMALALHLWQEDVSRDLLAAILFHDTSEYWAGDSPYPAKRGFPAFRRELDAMEEAIATREGVRVPLTNPTHRWMLTVVDSLECAWWAKRVHATHGLSTALDVMETALSAVLIQLEPGNLPGIGTMDPRVLAVVRHLHQSFYVDIPTRYQGVVR